MLEEAISASLREEAEDAAAATAVTPPEEPPSSVAEAVPPLAGAGSPGLAPSVVKRWAAGLRKGNFALREFLSGTPRDSSQVSNGSTLQETRRRVFASTWRPLMARKSPQPVPLHVQPTTLLEANVAPLEPRVRSPFFWSRSASLTQSARHRVIPALAQTNASEHAPTSVYLKRKGATTVVAECGPHRHESLLRLARS